MFVVVAALADAAPCHANTALQIATLAPKQSPWGKVFRAWSKAVDTKTAGNVQIRWLWNGVAGSERSVVGKIRTGELAGGAITAVGLSTAYEPIVALQMPGAFRTWEALDRAREKLRPEFDAELEKAGFDVVGWGDVGRAHAFSKGFVVGFPADVRGHSPAVTADDVIAPKVLAAIGGVTGHVGEVNEFLPMLQSGAIDMLTVPALAAEQLQWAAHLDHMGSDVVAFGIGATIMSKRALDQLAPDQKQVVMSTGVVASKLLTERIRKEDDEAYERLRRKMNVHDATSAERAAWEAVWKDACRRVKEALPGRVLEEIGYC